MATWDPAQYERFAAHRLRPATDLLARIPPGRFDQIRDLGCGGGQVTRLLAERYPEADIRGIDTSPEMLERARAAVPSARFHLGDLAALPADPDADLVVSNAALHWLDDHERVLRSWADALSQRSVIAVQMPRNHAAPSHRIVADTVRSPPFAARLAGVRGIAPVAEAARYAALLIDRGFRVDAWECEYIQVLKGETPVLDWLMGTTLRPYLDALGGDADGFLAALAPPLADAYPRRPDGTCLFPFRRVFCVAVKTR